MDNFAPETVPGNSEALHAFLVTRTMEFMQRSGARSGFTDLPKYHDYALQAVIAQLASREPHLLVTQMTDWLTDTYGMETDAARKVGRKAILAYAEALRSRASPHPAAQPTRPRRNRRDRGCTGGGEMGKEW